MVSKESAFKLYQNGSLTLKQGADLCGVDLYDFMTMLSGANIPVIDYSPEELEAEVSSLEFAPQTAAL
jgi:predicted HTH domain antitoxin